MGKGSKGRIGGKGKGKLKAAPLHSKFWEVKEETENREVLDDKIYSGTIQRYSWKQGWGFIMPDNPAALPKQVKAALSEARAAAEAAGKEVSDENLLYFRKPDVHHEDGFKLSQDVNVTFNLYIDDKGAGACEVTMA